MAFGPPNRPLNPGTPRPISGPKAFSSSLPSVGSNSLESCFQNKTPSGVGLPTDCYSNALRQALIAEGHPELAGKICDFINEEKKSIEKASFPVWVFYMPIIAMASKLLFDEQTQNHLLNISNHIFPIASLQVESYVQRLQQVFRQGD